MSSLDNRKNAFENKFVHDEELRFKATARRNKLFGLWAAAELGRADADAYAKEVVKADFEKPGDDDVIEKVAADFKNAGKPMTEATLRAQLAKMFDKAKEQIMSEA